jgi:hypothetical protein
MRLWKNQYLMHSMEISEREKECLLAPFPLRNGSEGIDSVLERAIQFHSRLS